MTGQRPSPDDYRDDSGRIDWQAFRAAAVRWVEHDRHEATRRNGEVPR
jgi:hypothetical protein